MIYATSSSRGRGSRGRIGSEGVGIPLDGRIGGLVVHDGVTMIKS